MTDHILESALESHFRYVCKKLGLKTLKLNLQQNRGYPDRLVVHKGKAHFAELKTEHGKQTPLQKFRAEELIKAGFNVPVLRSKTEITSYLESIRNDII